MTIVGDVGGRRTVLGVGETDLGGLHFAMQVIAPGMTARAERHAAIRRALVPVIALLRPHAFADPATRDAACRVPMLGGACLLIPASEEEHGAIVGGGISVAVGPGMGEAGFPLVALLIVDAELGPLAAGISTLGGLVGSVAFRYRSTILTVAGVHYQVGVDDLGDAQVRTKVPFGAANGTRVADTAGWLARRMEAHRK